jgi:hypothetical protein
MFLVSFTVKPAGLPIFNSFNIIICKQIFCTTLGVTPLGVVKIFEITDARRILEHLQHMRLFGTSQRLYVQAPILGPVRSGRGMSKIAFSGLSYTC